jgi:hypothetical protein
LASDISRKGLKVSMPGILPVDFDPRAGTVCEDEFSPAFCRQTSPVGEQGANDAGVGNNYRLPHVQLSHKS